VRLIRLTLAAGVIGAAMCAVPAVASPAHGLGLSSDVVRTTLILTLLAVIPSILICMTSFVRIIVVLSMVRHAFGMPETPPSPVLASLALFLTAFTMAPTLGAVNTAAVQPLLANKISVEEALAKGKVPFRDFMLAQTKDSDIETIYAVSHTPPPTRPDQVEILTLAPAFMLNELRVSFTIGFVILLACLLIDLVVSAILLSVGMMMVPPATISLPIKLLMFVLIDGWGLIIQGVLGSFK